MNIGTTLTALALIISGTTVLDDVQAAGLDAQRLPEFIQRAEIALSEGRLERAVGLIAPRVKRLHGDFEIHRAYAVLCNAHLRQQDYRSAHDACHMAVQTESTTWSDYNNLGAFYYLTGDMDTALVHFEQAASMAPETQAVSHNIEATAAAAGS